MTSAPPAHSKPGSVLLSYGFRPFFLFGAGYAAIAMIVWLPLFYGDVALPTIFQPRDWHAHEMLYGYVPAVVGGFLLTAIPNWTGRLPLRGRPLLLLVLAWFAGRLAVSMSAWLGWLPTAALDLSFLALLIAATAREIVAGKNWRNLKVIAPVSVLLLGNAAFHVEAHIEGAADYGIRIGVAAIIVLISLIGGRIIPSFTRNWLVRENPGRLPAPFDRFDAATLAVSILALLLWVVSPFAVATGIAMLAAAVLQVGRLARWAGDRTMRDRLVLILHVAYLFLPLGFLLLGCAALGATVPSAGLHAWMAGAVGTMTLAVMTRASLGHTGYALVADAGTQAVYGVVIAAAAVRMAAALLPQWSSPLLGLAAAAWAAAFAGFALLYAPKLLRPRRAAR